MKTAIKSAFILATVAMLAVGCEPDIVVDPPVPPTPTPAPDCSYSFTMAVQDTNGYYNSDPIVVLPLTQYVPGYRLLDLSFNPKDPNDFVASFDVVSNNLDTPLCNGCYAFILRGNLCTGEFNIVNDNFEFTPITLDWGANGLILIGLYSINNSLQVMKPNGDSLSTIFNGPYHTKVRWHSNDTLMVLKDISGQLHIMDLAGQTIESVQDFHADDFTFLSGDSIAFVRGGTVGIFDLESGVETILGYTSYSSWNYDIAYSAIDGSLLVVTDTLVSLINIESSQVSVLSNGFRASRMYTGAAASKNGYLAYLAETMQFELNGSGYQYYRSEIRFINPDGTDERRLVLDFE